MTRARRILGRLGGERGFSLIEVLATMTIFVVVLGATLSALGTFVTGVDHNQRRNDTQQQARSALDQIARELRNLASPVPNQPQAMDKATTDDLVFQTVDTRGRASGENTFNARRLRYCLDDTDPTAGVVWMQVQTWTQATVPAVPATASCPDPDARWVSRQAVASNVVNRINGQNRPLWAYDTTSVPEISFIRATVHIDRDPGRAPGESTLSTGVFLRNHNRAPAAAFTATITGDGHVLLNGSPSSDPEGQPLTYVWYDGTTTVGSGITYDYRAPVTGERTLSLTVSDPGGLHTTAPPQVVSVQ